MYRIFVPNIGFIGTETRESLQNFSTLRHNRLKPYNILIGGNAVSAKASQAPYRGGGAHTCTTCGAHADCRLGSSPNRRQRARAEAEWTRLFDDSKKCFHAQPCHRKNGQCNVNCRFHTEAVIAGAILPLWKALDEFTWTGKENDKFMRVTRVKLADGTRIVGVAVPWFKLKNWRSHLQHAGVPIDASALGVINLMEKDAADDEKRGKAEQVKAKHE